MRAMRRVILLFGVALALAGADLGTKYAVGPYDGGPGPEGPPPFFRVEPTLNPGGLGGALPAGNTLWTVFGFAVTGVVVYLLLARPRPARRPVLLDLALAAMLAGAAGNLYDRLAYGAVRDFLAFHFRLGGWSFSYPTFNLADAYLVIGVALYVLSWPRGKRAKAEAPEEAKAPAGTEEAEEAA